jgi:hypothetical protein
MSIWSDSLLRYCALYSRRSTLHRRFRGTCRQGKSLFHHHPYDGESEYLWNVSNLYETTQSNIPEGYLHTCRCENMKSHLKLILSFSTDINAALYHSLICFSSRPWMRVRMSLIKFIYIHFVFCYRKFHYEKHETAIKEISISPCSSCLISCLVTTKNVSFCIHTNSFVRKYHVVRKSKSNNPYRTSWSSG